MYDMAVATVGRAVCAGYLGASLAVGGPGRRIAVACCSFALLHGRIAAIAGALRRRWRRAVAGVRLARFRAMLQVDDVVFGHTVLAIAWPTFLLGGRLSGGPLYTMTHEQSREGGINFTIRCLRGSWDTLPSTNKSFTHFVRCVLRSRTETKTTSQTTVSLLRGAIPLLAAAGGIHQAADGGLHHQAADGGIHQAADGGLHQAADGGLHQAADGGLHQAAVRRLGRFDASAIAIQRAWRTAIYDPSRSLCKQRLLREFDEWRGMEQQQQLPPVPPYS